MVNAVTLFQERPLSHCITTYEHCVYSKFDWDFQSSYDFARANSMLENTKNDMKNICIFICSSRLSHQRVRVHNGLWTAIEPQLKVRIYTLWLSKILMSIVPIYIHHIIWSIYYLYYVVWQLRWILIGMASFASQILNRLKWGCSCRWWCFTVVLIGLGVTEGCGKQLQEIVLEMSMAWQKLSMERSRERILMMLQKKPTLAKGWPCRGLAFSMASLRGIQA